MVSPNHSHKVSAKDGETKIIPCRVCRSRTNHNVLCKVNTEDHSDENGIYVWDEYLIAQCAGCQDVSFEHTSCCSEDYEFDEDGSQVPRDTVKIYPNRIVGRGELRNSYELPHGVYNVYRETYEALCSNQMILAGIGIRAIVEAVCVDRGLKGSLVKMIDLLFSYGDISLKNADFLHRLRFMGNVSVHQAKAHSIDELSVAFEVAENLLSNAYIIPKMASRSLPKKPINANSNTVPKVLHGSQKSGAASGSPKTPSKSRSKHPSSASSKMSKKSP